MAPEVDSDVLRAIDSLAVSCPGEVNYSLVGVTAIGSSRILLITKKIGTVHQFVSLLRLGSLAHVSDEEAAACVAIIVADARHANETGARHRRIASISVDGVATAEAMRQALILADMSKTSVVSHNPAHSIDLACEDVARCECLGSTIATAREIIRFVNTDRIDGIKKELVAMKQIPSCGEGGMLLMLSEARAYLTCDVLAAAGKQQPLTASLAAGNSSYIAYRSELGADERAHLDATLTQCSRIAYDRIDLAAKVFEPFKYAVHVVSSEQLPVSAYFPLIVALRTALSALLRDPVFDATFGDGAGTEVDEMLKVRFNMDGSKPARATIAVLDTYHLFACFCDPFSRQIGLEWDEYIEGGVAAVIAGMLEWAYPGDGAAAKEMRCKLNLELVAFNTGTGKYKYRFVNAAAPFPEWHVLTMKDVSEWVARTGGIESRIAWFETFAKDELLYRDIAKPLLSLGVANSITLERAVRPFKSAVLSEDSDRLLDPLLVRAGLNLRFLHELNSGMERKGAQLEPV
jgi:hypothetical protein